jgi:hypothetical protein
MSRSTKKFPQLKMCDNCEELFLLKCIFCWLTAFGYSNNQTFISYSFWNIKRKVLKLKKKIDRRAEPSNDYFIKILFLLSKWFQTRIFLWEFPIGSYITTVKNYSSWNAYFVDSLLLVTQIIKRKQLYYKMWSRKS